MQTWANLLTRAGPLLICDSFALAQFAIHGASVTFVDVSECARFGGMIICIAYMWHRPVGTACCSHA